MAEGNCVGCGSITKHVCLKCSVPASENYLGWKECKKGDLCFKCNQEQQATDYRQDSSDEKENEEVARTLDDVELVIYSASRVVKEYRKIWSSKFGQKRNIKRDKINLFDPYATGLYCEIRGKIASLTLVGYLP